MIDRSDRHRRFSRHLLGAMGLGSIAAIALTGACGGNVVVDTTTGTGASGGQGGAGGTYAAGTVYPAGTGACYTGTSTCGTYATTTYGTTTTFEAAVGVGGASPSGAGVGGSDFCNPATPPGQYATQVCLPNQQCLQDSGAQLMSLLSQQLGVCDATSPGSCCGQPSIANLDCGPVYPMGNACCWVVTVTESTAC